MTMLYYRAADPSAWGYLPLRPNDPSASYKPDPRSTIPPFELHLLGGRGKLEVPAELQEVVKIHFNLVRLGNPSSCHMNVVFNSLHG